MWPVWNDFLTSPATGLRPTVEGGLRLAGVFKNNCPELPLVSYVTVVRNNKQTLARTIVSVLAQTYPNVEHIIIDGDSTDGTLEIIKKFADRIDYFASEPDSGLYDALNKAIPLAHGRLICVLNSDDWLEVDAAETAARSLDILPDSALIFSAAKVDIGSQVIIWQPSQVSLSSYFTCANCCHNAIYATRSAYSASGPYDSNYRIAADFKWIMRCLDTGSAFFYTDIPTVNYSLGGISSDVDHHRLECKRLIQERFPYLSLDEVVSLHYCYYHWRERLNSEEVEVSFNAVDFIDRLRKKYLIYDELLEALINPERDKKVKIYSWKFKTFIKKLCVRHPRIYSLISKAYRAIKY